MTLVDRVMVTGGAGFIGSNLVDRLLAEGVSVDVVDDLSTGSLANLAEARGHASRGLSFFQVSVCDSSLTELMQRRKPRILYHLAAQADVRRSMTDPVYDAEVNLIGSIRVLDAARRSGVQKVVYAASGGTLYGELGSPDIAASEKFPRAQSSFYGTSKAAVLDYLEGFRSGYDLEFTALALGNVYGPRQDPKGEAGVVSIFGSYMLAGKATTIFGDGGQTRDFVFVDDVVDAFFRASDQGGGLVINVGSGSGTTVIQLHDAVSRVVGYSKQPEFAPMRPGEIRYSRLDNSAALLHLGWKPWTSIEQGISRTVAWLDKPGSPE
ncbi:MAG: NAD-dependent epimerase/dehydratase family protein [Acidimicrobiaceae bacterium]|nr:NAD-dependent epimerase/dehydratase family protein [Acidimicrobiaceae bacterium]